MAGLEQVLTTPAPEVTTEELKKHLEGFLSKVAECQTVIEIAVAAGIVLNELRGVPLFT